MPRPRPLHVLVPAALVTAALLAPSAPVAAAPIPAASVVCIDVGHGGSDPGALGLDGLVEKNLTLDISDRLAGLLRADGVTVVLTRTTDATVSIAQRAATCIDAHADVMLAIYINAWYTPAPEGSVVLYPYARDIPFARAIDRAVGAYIAPYGGHDGGIVLRSNWWLTPPMPVATIEPLFITNPHDAALLAQPAFRQGLAGALRSGIESYLPGILARKSALATPTPAVLPQSGGAGGSGRSGATGAAQPVARSHPAASGPSAPSPASGAGNPLGTLLLWLCLTGGAALAFRHRRTLAPLVLRVGGLAVRAAREAAIRRNAHRRRERAARARAGAAGATALRVPLGRHLRRARAEGAPMALRGRRVDPLPARGAAGRRASSDRLGDLLPEEDALPAYDPLMGGQGRTAEWNPPSRGRSRESVTGTTPPDRWPR